MFGAFALDVSNFQAGSFGTPAFFLAIMAGSKSHRRRWTYGV
jgi:hypothetical protein